MTARPLPTAWPDAAGPVPPQHAYVVCEECDAVYHARVVASDDVLRCRRCGATLERGHGLPLNGQLGLTLGALLVFLIGSLSPIVTLELKGNRTEASLLEAVRLTWVSGAELVALLSLATTFVFPLLVIVLRLWVVVPLLRRRPPPQAPLVMRVLRWMQRWSMVEVFMLGVLIAVVRSAGVTHLVLGPGIFAYMTLTVLLTAMHAAGLQGLWREISRPAS